MFNPLKSFSSFSVNDIAKARQFYENLGIESEDQMGGLQLKLDGDRKIFVYLKPDHQPAVYTILNFLVKDLKEAAGQLKDKEISLEHYDNLTNDEGLAGTESDAEGPKIAWFKDPAGNILSILEEND